MPVLRNWVVGVGHGSFHWTRFFCNCGSVVGGTLTCVGCDRTVQHDKEYTRTKTLRYTVRSIEACRSLLIVARVIQPFIDDLTLTLKASTLNQDPPVGFGLNKWIVLYRKEGMSCSFITVSPTNRYTIRELYESGKKSSDRPRPRLCDRIRPDELVGIRLQRELTIG